MNLGEKFAAAMNQAGIKVHGAVSLGKWLHIDTNQDQEMNIRSTLYKMGAIEIKVLPLGADGRHLDGSRHHRVVATF